MSEVATKTDARGHYVAEFERRAAGRAHEPAWLRALRSGAMEIFSERGFPTTREEDWKYTNLSALARRELPIESESATHAVGAESLERCAFGFGWGAMLVFVAGRFRPDLSDRAGLPDGVTARSLAEILATDPSLAERVLGSLVDHDKHRMAALNTALFADGAFIHLAAGARCDRPIKLLFLGGKDGVASFAQPRICIVAEENSSVSVVENYSDGHAAGYYATNAVTEIDVGSGASVTHYKLQREGLEADHIGSIHARAGNDATLRSVSVSTGANLARTDICVEQAGRGMECVLDGLYVVRGKQHVDHHTVVDHALPHGASRENYKGILDDSARAVFNGRVVVRPGAQRTDAQQQNRNLLLSSAAEIDAKPELEIYADDVRCSHGATIGQLDPDEIFYLRSRGIDEATARDLLTWAFASDVVGRIDIDQVRSRLEEFLASRFSRAAVLETEK